MSVYLCERDQEKFAKITIDLNKEGKALDDKQIEFHKKLSHLHIIRFFDQLQVEEYLYIITEYVDGESLLSK